MRMASERVLVSLFLMMVILVKVNFMQISRMVLGNMFGKMVIFTLDNKKMEKKMATDNKLMEILVHTMVSMRMIKPMDMELNSIMKVDYIMVNGKRGCIKATAIR